MYSEEEYQSRECPKCHSIKSRIMLYLGQYTCLDCGYKWMDQTYECKHQWDDIEPIECITCGIHKERREKNE